MKGENKRISKKAFLNLFFIPIFFFVSKSSSIWLNNEVGRNEMKKKIVGRVIGILFVDIVVVSTTKRGVGENREIFSPYPCLSRLRYGHGQI